MDGPPEKRPAPGPGAGPPARREVLPEQRDLGGTGVLEWVRLSPTRDCELRAGDAVVGEMTASTRPGFRAWGECFGASWDFRLGPRFLRGWEMVAVPGGEDEPELRFRALTLLHGSLRLRGGREYRLGWGGHPWRHAVRDGRGILFRLDAPFGTLFRPRIRVTLRRRAWDDPHLPLLLLATWLLRLTRQTPWAAFPKAR